MFKNRQSSLCIIRAQPRHMGRDCHIWFVPQEMILGQWLRFKDIKYDMTDFFLQENVNKFIYIKIIASYHIQENCMYLHLFKMIICKKVFRLWCARQYRHNKIRLL